MTDEQRQRVRHALARYEKKGGFRRKRVKAAVFFPQDKRGTEIKQVKIVKREEVKNHEEN